jgi:hypothetical protein
MPVDSAFCVVGTLAGHPRAAAYAGEVAALLRGYARDVVAAFGLCPHLRDLDRSLGAVCIVLDRVLDGAAADRAAKAARDVGDPIVHLVFPLATIPGPAFERFGNSIAERLVRDGGSPLVHATFHPALTAEGALASRLLGLARRAPDPFVQLVPADAGSSGSAGSPGGPRIEAVMSGEVVARVTERLAALVAERVRRDAAYADLVASACRGAE